MDNVLEKINKIIDLMGFRDARVSVDEEHRRISIFIDAEMTQPQIILLLSAFDHLFNLMLRREHLPSCVVDLNYYRKERERLIAELAKAAAHKATVTKAEVSLPPMNAYERRLVHMEISGHPELKTESVGEGKERHVVIKRLE